MCNVSLERSIHNELLLPFCCDLSHLVVPEISVFLSADSSQIGRPQVEHSCRGGRPLRFESRGCAVVVVVVAVVVVEGNSYSQDQHVLLATMRVHCG